MVVPSLPQPKIDTSSDSVPPDLSGKDSKDIKISDTSEGGKSYFSKLHQKEEIREEDSPKSQPIAHIEVNSFDDTLKKNQTFLEDESLEGHVR